MMCRAAVIYLNKAIEQLEKNEHTNATELIMGAYREIIHEEGHMEAQEGRDSAKLRYRPIPDEALPDGDYLVRGTGRYGKHVVLVDGVATCKDYGYDWDELGCAFDHIAGPIDPPEGE